VPLSVERASERWAIKMDTQGFPPRLDLFKAMAAHLAQKQADEYDDPSIAELGKNWLTGFLNRHPNFRLTSRLLGMLLGFILSILTQFLFPSKLNTTTALQRNTSPSLSLILLLGRSSATTHLTRFAMSVARSTLLWTTEQQLAPLAQ